MKYRKACVITKNYPDSGFIERGIFVEKLVREWSSKGLSVDVVAPQSIVHLFRQIPIKKFSDLNIAGNRILRPLYFSVSNKSVLEFDMNRLSRNWFLKAAQKGVSGLTVPDFFYGKFLQTGGLAALNAGRVYNRPCFADIGESVLTERLNDKDRELAAQTVQSLDGIVCVSDELKEEVMGLGADPGRVISQPNTADMERFNPRDQTDCRRKLSLPEDLPVVIFVGHFIERKGPLRVLKAIEQASDLSVKGVFIGRGEQKPKGEHVLHTGPVPNDELPVWLNAADLFVLPTQQEGHCNAINEAMACGLPIVSSEIPEVKNQVPKDAGLLVNPDDVQAIEKAMRRLIDNPEERKEMGQRAYQVQSSRSSKSRSAIILEWLDQLLTTKQYTK